MVSKYNTSIAFIIPIFLLNLQTSYEQQQRLPNKVLDYINLSEKRHLLAHVFIIESLLEQYTRLFSCCISSVKVNFIYYLLVDIIFLIFEQLLGNQMAQFNLPLQLYGLAQNKLEWLNFVQSREQNLINFLIKKLVPNKT